MRDTLVTDCGTLPEQRKRIAIATTSPNMELRGDLLGDVSVFNYVISQTGVSERELLDSFVSTPSRYVHEMVRRTLDDKGNYFDWLLIINPLFRLTRIHVESILFTLARPLRNLVVGSANGLPVAYLFNTALILESQYLLLLSCSSGSIDRNLLSSIYFSEFEYLTIPIYVSRLAPNGFVSGSYLKPMEWCAQHATKLIQSAVSDRTTQAEGTAIRNRIRFIAFFPHHAGDVLFISIATTLGRSSIYDGIAVHEDYAAIAAQVPCALPLQILTGPVPNRNGYRKDDPDHFLEVCGELDKDCFHVYCRTTRNYNVTNFHFIDHFLFCLGAEMRHADNLSRGRPLVPKNRQRKASAESRFRVLIHAGAGWPLKVYPQESLLALAAMLIGRGIEVWTLDSFLSIPNCTPIRFSDLSNYNATLEDVDLVIGMDSFPAHYSSLIVGLPTICLFSSTHPVHSRTEASSSYVALSNAMSCSPCLGFDKCRRYGTKTCANFASPESILELVEQYYEFRTLMIDAARRPDPPAPATKCPGYFSGDKVATISIETTNLSASASPLPFNRIGTQLFEWQTLFREFCLTAYRDGILKAISLALAFIRRQRG